MELLRPITYLVMIPGDTPVWALKGGITIKPVDIMGSTTKGRLKVDPRRKRPGARPKWSPSPRQVFILNIYTMGGDPLTCSWGNLSH
jgi:hypothetical protein